MGITAALVRIRFGSPDRIYSLNIPQWQHPVYVRGGKSSDTTILYEMLVTNEYQLDKLESPATIIDGGANIGSGLRGVPQSFSRRAGHLRRAICWNV